MHCTAAIRRLLITSYAILATAGPLWAHALDARCVVRGEHLEVKARYDDGTLATGAKVAVFDVDGNLLAQATTDSGGLAMIPAPKLTRYRVVVDDGIGHRSQQWVGEAVPLAPEEPAGFPWLKVGIGVAAIVSLSLAAWLALRRSAHAKNKAAPPRVL